MRIEKDFKEFIELLNCNKVKYLVVGGFAIAFHATARFTKDIDIFCFFRSSDLLRFLASSLPVLPSMVSDT